MCDTQAVWYNVKCQLCTVSNHEAHLLVLLVALKKRPENWPNIERELQQRWEREVKAGKDDESFRVMGFEWRVLRFNTVTRQSVAKVMLVAKDGDPSQLYFMQQPNCVAFECEYCFSSVVWISLIIKVSVEIEIGTVKDPLLHSCIHLELERAPHGPWMSMCRGFCTLCELIQCNRLVKLLNS